MSLPTAISIALSFSALAASAESITIQSGDDVQILQAWRSDGRIELDHLACTGDDPVEGNTTYKDCRQQGQALTRAEWADRDSPAISPWLLPVTRRNGLLYSQYYYGHLVEVRALVKRSALDSSSFAGIGFYTSHMLFADLHFVDKDALHIVSSEDVTLVTGEKAAVLRFVAWMPGLQGMSGTSWNLGSVAFKPFAEFREAEEIFQVWDQVPENYRIYRSNNGAGRPQPIRFDRQGELLQQP